MKFFLPTGVCVTALLVVLVGCRLKEVKRRVRRHRGAGKSYAHDADYLVNGMYLWDVLTFSINEKIYFIFILRNF